MKNALGDHSGGVYIFASVCHIEAGENRDSPVFQKALISAEKRPGNVFDTTSYYDKASTAREGPFGVVDKSGGFHPFR